MSDDLESQLRTQVLLAARELARRLDDVWGHVTCRIPGGGSSPGFYLKHLRIPRGGDPDLVNSFGYDGTAIDGGWAAPFGGAEVLPKEIRDDIEARRAGDERPPALWRYIEWSATGK